VPAPPNAAPVEFGADPVLLNFLGAPKAQVRVATVRIPGTTMNIEIVEFKDIDRKPIQPRVQDPGANVLGLLVRDLDTLLSHLKQQGVQVVTVGGSPININGNRSA
jgi:hypothetical protein